MLNKFSLLIYVLLIFSCSSSPKIPQGSDLMKFDSSYWQRILIDRDSIILKNDDRQKMLNDLCTNILPGKTKDQIIVLLGDSEYNSLKNQDDLRYATGWDRSSYFPNMDSEWLLITFDENEVFNDFFVFTS